MTLPRIAIDAMGGDEGVRVMVEGAALARRDHADFQFLLVGDQARIERALDDHPGLRGASEILHCDDVVGGDEQLPPVRPKLHQPQMHERECIEVELQPTQLAPTLLQRLTLATRWKR